MNSYKKESKRLLEELNIRLENTDFRLVIKEANHGYYELTIKKNDVYFAYLHCTLSARELYLILSAFDDAMYYNLFQNAKSGIVSQD